MRYMAAVLAESDACLELVEQELLEDRVHVPGPLRERLTRLVTAAGSRLGVPPKRLRDAHKFVFAVQAERLMVVDDDDAEGAALPSARRKRFSPRAVSRPLLGTFEWFETQRSLQAQSHLTDPGWAFEVWREAADLARLYPSPGRAPAMQDAWDYYWALVGDDEVPAEPARRAA